MYFVKEYSFHQSRMGGMGMCKDICKCILWATLDCNKE